MRNIVLALLIILIPSIARAQIAGQSCPASGQAATNTATGLSFICTQVSGVLQWVQQPSGGGGGGLPAGGSVGQTIVNTGPGTGTWQNGNGVGLPGSFPQNASFVFYIVPTILNISAVTASGGNNTYTYTLTSGTAPVTNQYIFITGMGNAGNNGPFQITGTGSGTFTVVDAGGVTNAGQTGTGTINLVVARNNQTGAIDTSSTDVCTAVNTILTANANVGGTLFFKNGVYNGFTLTTETVSGWTNFSYCIGIPGNAQANWVQWHFIGEQRPVAALEGGGGPYTNGVVFNLTQLPITPLGASQYAIVWAQRPNAAVTFANEIYFQNMGAQFPVNTRGFEIAFEMYPAVELSYDNVIANFAVSNVTLSASTPGSNSYGITSAVGGSGNTMSFHDVYSAGYQYCYDLEGEHIEAVALNSIYCTFAGTYGANLSGHNPGNTIFHHSWMAHVVDQENANGWVIGAAIANGALLDIEGMDIEYLTSGTFARVQNMTDLTNFPCGHISYETVLAGTGGTDNSTLFASGGACFQITSANKSSVPGTLVALNGSVATTGTTKQTLQTYTINNQRINNASGNPNQNVLHIKGWGTTAANANSKVVEIDMNGTLVGSITSTGSGVVVIIECDMLFGFTSGGTNFQSTSCKGDDGTVHTTSYVQTNDVVTTGVNLTFAATTPTSAGDFAFKAWIISMAANY